MVEYYDPERVGGGGVEPPEPPVEVRMDDPPGSAAASDGPPTIELLIMAVAAGLILVSAWSQWAFMFGSPMGWLFLAQSFHPVVIALLAAAVASLLLRRGLRRLRVEQSAELSRLHAELSALRSELAGGTWG